MCRKDRVSASGVCPRSQRKCSDKSSTVFRATEYLREGRNEGGPREDAFSSSFRPQTVFVTRPPSSYPKVVCVVEVMQVIGRAETHADPIRFRDFRHTTGLMVEGFVALEISRTRFFVFA
mmetsp:Transcript_26544/g.69744  ORF Transcript_26544/g.69744 Transcript_26544/m.69744 type:complete len:120 (+) Transcript_26544:254-613(+)